MSQATFLLFLSVLHLISNIKCFVLAYVFFSCSLMIRFSQTSEIEGFRCNTLKKKLFAIWLMVIGFLLAKFEFRVVFGDRRVDKLIPGFG